MLPIADFGDLSLADIAPFIAIGFIAQLIDGAPGMAFGVISQTLLVSIGVPPAAASASVHLVEVFTTGASGASHIVQRNVDWDSSSGWFLSASQAVCSALTYSPISMHRSRAHS